MYNTLYKENNAPNRWHQDPGPQTLEKSFSPPSREIKRRFKEERKFSISRPSDARWFVKKGTRFCKVILRCLRLSPGKTKETLNTFVTAFKDRKLTSQVLSLYLTGKDGNLRKFAVALHSQRNVSALTLDFRNAPELTQQGMKFLALRLGRMYLSELKISLANNFVFKIPVEGLSPLFSCLKRLTCLLSLTLVLQYNKTLKLPTIKELFSSFNGMRRLERLRISIKNSLIEDEAVEGLLFGLGKLKHISHLSFDIFHSSNLINLSPFNNVPRMLTSLKCLTSLELILNFWRTKMEDPIITRISSGLKSLTSLKNLTLSLFPYGPRFVECGAESLSEALREMKSLQKLDLHFSVAEFTKEYQDKLSSGFKGLEMLKHLSLFLRFDKVSEKDIESFSLVFMNMKALNVLQLEFGSFNKFDKNIIHILCENLKRVSSLKHFFLKIYTNEELEEQEKKRFIFKLRNVKVNLLSNIYKGGWDLHFTYMKH